MMNRGKQWIGKTRIRAGVNAPRVGITVGILLIAVAAPITAQNAITRDPAEPVNGKTAAKIVPRATGRILRQTVDEKGMRAPGLSGVRDALSAHRARK